MPHLRWNTFDFEIKDLKLEGNTLSGVVNGESVRIPVVSDGNELVVENGGSRYTVFGAVDQDRIIIQVGGHVTTFVSQRDHGTGLEETEGDGRVTAPMPGRILELMVSEGDMVEKDQVLVLMESMKLQVEVRSPRTGTVDVSHIEEGSMVDGGELLLIVVEAED